MHRGEESSWDLAPGPTRSREKGIQLHLNLGRGSPWEPFMFTRSAGLQGDTQKASLVWSKYLRVPSHSPSVGKVCDCPGFRRAWPPLHWGGGCGPDMSPATSPSAV